MGTTFAFIIPVSGVTIRVPPTPSSHRRRVKDWLFFCFGRAAADGVKTFQQSYLERHGAY